VNVFPARRARDVLMLMGLLFAITLVLLIRFMQPERLLNVRSLPDVTAFFSALQSPITPLLPSFWAGEAIFAGLQSQLDLFQLSCLWTSALGCVLLARIAYDRHYLAGFSKAQEARKARFTRLAGLEAVLGRLPVSVPARSLLIKDLKVFLRDTTQWSQLLLLVALMAVYLYNFKVLDIERIPYMAGVIRNVYAFVNLALAGFVLAAVSVRFVFPAVSAEGPAFWLIRTSPVSMSAFLWSKFWTGLVPVVLLAEILTIVSNELLGSASFLKWVCAGAIFFMSFGLVGMAAGFGARYPRFDAENLTQVSSSYGGIAFMVLAVAFIVVEIVLLGWPTSIYLWHRHYGMPMAFGRQLAVFGSIGAAVGLSLVTFWWSMRSGIRALEEMEGP
jgi:ABC-2 type transport system permease protein